MTAPNPAPTFALDPTTHGAILAGFYRDGQNTCEIGRALDLPEAQVAEVVRVERERRVAAHSGRQER